MNSSNVRPEREYANGEVGDSRIAEAPQSLDDGRLVACGAEVADIGGVAVLEQPLVVRRVLGVPERLVRPRARCVHFVVGAHDDGNPGHDPRCRPAGVGRGFRDARGNVLTDRPLVRHPENRARRVFARDAEHHRRERGEEDRCGDDVGDVERIVDAVPVVLDIHHARTGEGRVQDLEVGAHLVRRSFVGQAEHVLDDPVVRRAQPQREAALADRLVRQRLLRHGNRMAGLDRHDRGADLDPVGGLAHEGDRGEGVELVGDLRYPDRGEPAPLGRFGIRDELGHLFPGGFLFKSTINPIRMSHLPHGRRPVDLSDSGRIWQLGSLFWRVILRACSTVVHTHPGRVRGTR